MAYGWRCTDTRIVNRLFNYGVLFRILHPALPPSSVHCLLSHLTRYSNRFCTQIKLDIWFLTSKCIECTQRIYVATVYPNVIVNGILVSLTIYNLSDLIEWQLYSKQCIWKIHGKVDNPICSLTGLQTPYHVTSNNTILEHIHFGYSRKVSHFA